MIAINSTITDPYLNHAVEEVLLQDFAEDIFMLWKNQTCILIGKNQNTYSEINTQYVRQQGIAVVRRPTGGGTVFNDHGNLNFTFITSRQGAEFADFQRFTRPIVEALRALGANAEYRGRNDLVIDGKKFSGNAQAWFKDRVLHHGTLLYSADLGMLQKALNVNSLKLLSKSIPSVASRVTNISGNIPNPPDVHVFKDYLFAFVAKYTDARQTQLTNQQLERAQQIADKKYRLPQHNFGEDLRFDMQRSQKFWAGLVTAEINVREGRIADIRFTGDYFSRREQHELVQKLKGTEYDYQSILRVLNYEDIDAFFAGITAQQLASVII